VSAPLDDEAAARAEVEELRRQLAEAPAEDLVANHAYGLFELAAIHLSSNPPNLEAARLAIDAMGALIEKLEGRLGEHERSLADGLAQIRLAWVQMQISQAAQSGPRPDGGSSS
jgi:hypothetical protein